MTFKCESFNVKGKICAFCFSFWISESSEKGKVLSRIEKIFEYLFYL